MDDFGMTYDIKTGVFIDENSGFILDATYVMMEDTEKIQEKIQKNCGVEVDELFIEVLRDTVETCVPTFPFGN